MFEFRPCRLLSQHCRLWVPGKFEPRECRSLLLVLLFRRSLSDVQGSHCLSCSICSSAVLEQCALTACTRRESTEHWSRIHEHTYQLPAGLASREQQRIQGQQKKCAPMPALLVRSRSFATLLGPLWTRDGAASDMECLQMQSF